MMQPIVDSTEILRWAALAGDDPKLPFEAEVGRKFAYFAYSDYSALFLAETIDAARSWSAKHELRPFAMFFTIPDPSDYFTESGSFGGLTATGADDLKDILSFLTHDNQQRAFLSPYDVSHRFHIVPEDRSWLWVGDRDADLAIFGFSTEAQKSEFSSTATFGTFATLDEVAAHAMTFMSYPLSKACFKGQ